MHETRKYHTVAIAFPTRPDWRIQTESGLLAGFHYITLSKSFIKNTQRCFCSQIFAEAISIWGKPINIYKFYAIPRPINITFIQKYNFYKGISSLFKMIYKIDVQSSNCFYKISMLKKNGVNVYVGAYSAILSL